MHPQSPVHQQPDHHVAINMAERLSMWIALHTAGITSITMVQPWSIMLPHNRVEISPEERRSQETPLKAVQPSESTQAQAKLQLSPEWPVQ